MRILSGIKPSGRPHLGNYLGALRKHIDLQNKGEQCLYFIADYHALTTLRDPKLLQDYRRGVVLDYLALGLDPNKVTLFYQSDVPEHAELQWILSTVTNPGLLERAHAWKDAKEKHQRDINAGLFMYPTLMAADILIYNADKVPVGKDQKQHIEIARDIATSFNNYYGETFKLPEELIEDDVATIIGTDGQKMSKSYNNTISIFDDEDTIKKQIMGIKTASIDLKNPMPTKDDIILTLYEQFSSSAEMEELKDNYVAGGFGYGKAKEALLNKLLEYFQEAREKRATLSSSNLDEIMNEGAKTAH
ncbi:tryptophan--tRNA ligase, partial [Patescibacteria group bacterium]|nr:tryptophan--tRNA ligase [Patescibacteria group bacterium]